MTRVNWDSWAALAGLRAVIDPNDPEGFKNRLIDALHWEALRCALKRGTRLLDFGCGVGRFANRIADRGISYVGIDSSQRMIEAAKRENPRGQYHRVTGAATPFDTGEFDACLFSWVFQYIIAEEHCEAIVAEVARVLRPGGSLLLLEQASASGGKSGSVSAVSTEGDFERAISSRFDVASVRRIRPCGTPQLRYLSFRIAKRFPRVFPVYLRYLAAREVRRYERQPMQYFETALYYDVLLTATRRATPPSGTTINT